MRVGVAAALLLSSGLAGCLGDEDAGPIRLWTTKWERVSEITAGMVRYECKPIAGHRVMATVTNRGDRIYELGAEHWQVVWPDGPVGYMAKVLGPSIEIAPQGSFQVEFSFCNASAQDQRPTQFWLYEEEAADKGLVLAKVPVVGAA